MRWITLVFLFYILSLYTMSWILKEKTKTWVPLIGTSILTCLPNPLQPISAVGAVGMSIWAWKSQVPVARNTPRQQLQGKVCLVTGGTIGGIGFQIAKMLATQQATVVLTTTRGKKTKHAIESIRQETGNHQVYGEVLELGSKQSIQNLVKRLENLGKVDVLINNAGILKSDMKNQDFNVSQVMAVNFAGPFYLTRLLGPLLLKGDARIINVTSAVGLLPDNMDLTFQGDYMQSKLALILMTACLRKQNLGASCVHPGVVQSNILNMKSDLVFSSPLNPLRPWMKTVEEGAMTIALLASGDQPCDHLYFGPSGEFRDEHQNCDLTVFWEKASALVGLRP